VPYLTYCAEEQRKTVFGKSVVEDISKNRHIL
jgi:hypothetical protein